MVKVIHMCAIPCIQGTKMLPHLPYRTYCFVYCLDVVQWLELICLSKLPVFCWRKNWLTLQRSWISQKNHILPYWEGERSNLFIRVFCWISPKSTALVGYKHKIWPGNLTYIVLFFLNGWLVIGRLLLSKRHSKIMILWIEPWDPTVPGYWGY